MDRRGQDLLPVAAPRPGPFVTGQFRPFDPISGFGVAAATGRGSPAKGRERKMRKILPIAVLIGLLALSGAVAWRVWSALDGVEMTVHGYVALAAGVTLSIVVGGGLMALVFFSARKGYDAIDDPSRDDR